MKKQFFILSLTATVFASCESKYAPVADDALRPTIITEVVPNDTDDPAIWVNPNDSTEVIIIGTDKHEKTGGLYAYDLEGNIINKVTSLDRPNNVDIAYGFSLAGKKTDIAVVTERGTDKIRVFSLPDLRPLDNGGIPVFEGEKEKSPMGIALFTKADTASSKIFAIVGRKTGPTGRYLFQYELQDKNGVIVGHKVREFGEFRGGKEIEAIAVDNELGYIYYADEGFGIHKYYADPDKGNQGLAIFGQKDFKEDHEGIAIYKTSDSTGYIVASNQQNNSFNIYPRAGDHGRPHQYTRIAEVPVSAIECDGVEVISMPIGPKFPQGMLVAMSNGMVFHYYDWKMFQELIDGKN
ncbi:MAG: phytase [Sphingobacterium sp.]